MEGGIKMPLFKKKPKLTPEQLAQEQAQLEADKALAQGTSTIRDVIAPAALKVDFNYLQIGNFYLRSFFVYSYPRYLYTDWLTPLINSDFSLNTALYIYPVGSKDILKKLRTKSAQIQSSFAEQAQKGLVRDPALETAYQDVEELRDTLQRGEEKFFRSSLYFTILAKDLEELNSLTGTLENILGSQLVLSKQTLMQQEQGFNTTLPLAINELMITKNFDTGALSTFFPFVSNELSRNEGILYGVNRHTNGLVIFDRFTLENANSVVLAKSGSGKSYMVKLEMLRYLMLGSEVIVIDPENEYEELSDAVGGTYLNININSNERINPFDLPKADPANPGEAEDHLRSNIIILHGLVRVMVGGKMAPTEDNLLDQGLVQTYAAKGITKDPSTHGLQPPTIDDLVRVLESMRGAERLAASLKKYSEGTYAGLFNKQTNISLENKFVVFSIRDLEEELRPVAMYMVLNFIWNRVRSEKKKRLLTVDEAWILMKYEDSAQFLFSIAKRARKYYLGLTTISQDVEDFLGSAYGKAIVNNSSLTFLLKQHPAVIDKVARVFNITQAEKYFLLNSEVGEGLFFAGMNHVAIQVVASYQEDLLINTNPAREEQKEG
ncbi:MAG: ATP-binding protein [Patescibacteria group bacterium]|nr:ATP-binding protein [Patescibacteria group bacterium]